MISQEYLKSIFKYDPETGLFIRTFRVANAVKIGDVAGTKTRKGYIGIKIKSQSYMAHRLAWLYMTGAWPVDQIDHINMIKDDNRWENLRESSNAQNKMNSGVYANSRSGLKGVRWRAQRSRWVAWIKTNGKEIVLGSFLDKREAAKAYDAAAIKYFGDFAKTNKSLGLI